jgi:UDP-N-acetylmuramyl pentapeptide phosphotransferase/UDP-N-acetylglucosamine-1-phosphate transferase
MNNLVVSQFAWIASLIASLVIVLTTKWHGRFSLDGLSGVQKFHVTPTPRIGGVALVIGLLVGWQLSSDGTRELLGLILVAGLPAFCFGLAEDLTKRVSVRARLFATMASGVLGWLLLGASITHVGVPGLDALLSVAPFAVLFTAFAVGGVANSVNIIDGFNGLASGAATISLFALGFVAQGCGDAELANICFIVAAVTVGFFMMNFPFGKLFLGDGGAYLLGFLLAWLAVMLTYRNPGVSVWSPLLAVAYPIFETVFTIARRVWKRQSPGLPDSAHLHSLIKIGVVLRRFPALRADLRNALVSPFCWMVAAIPACLSVLFATSTPALLWSCLLSFGVYLAFYAYVAGASSQQKSAEVVHLADLADLGAPEVHVVRRAS